MDKKNVKNFDQLSNRLQQALSEFEKIKNNEKNSDNPLVDEKKTKEILMSNIKNLINDLS